MALALAHRLSWCEIPHLSNNNVGIAADQSAIVLVGQSTITANGTGWTSMNGGQVLSYSNNNVSGNTVDGTLTSTVSLK